MTKLILGAAIGDIVGSVYEFNNIKTKSFPLFSPQCQFTDDTVLTAAVASALIESDAHNNPDLFHDVLIHTIHAFCKKYPHAGYGGMFLKWLVLKDTKPYNSFGNGSAMRVSPVGWYAKSLEEAENLAKISAMVTHNHPEGIKGAQSVAGAVFLAKNGAFMPEIKEYCEKYYNLDFTLDEIRPDYEFDETCQKTVPQAIVAFLESTSFEDAIRNAISIGGDSDTIAAITGSIAEAYYGVDESIAQAATEYLDEFILSALAAFCDAV